MDLVTDSAGHSAVDILQTDLYDAPLRGPVLDTPEFYAACARCLAPQSIMTVNLFADYTSFEKNLVAMRPAFAQILCMPRLPKGNAVAIAFKSAPQFDAAQLLEQAAHITKRIKLPTSSWRDAFQGWQASNHAS